MKKCTQCGELKALSLFNNRKIAKDGKASACKECNKKHVKAHYQKNKQSYILRARNYINKNKKWVREYKKLLVCSICGEGRDRPWILDFHHRDPLDKIDTIGKILITNSLEKVKKEIAKCDIVCSNCHRDIHHKMCV